mgnify:CR=1 FL=1
MLGRRPEEYIQTAALFGNGCRMMLSECSVTKGRFHIWHSRPVNVSQPVTAAGASLPPQRHPSIMHQAAPTITNQLCAHRLAELCAE